MAWNGRVITAKGEESFTSLSVEALAIVNAYLSVNPRATVVDVKKFFDNSIGLCDVADFHDARDNNFFTKQAIEIDKEEYYVQRWTRYDIVPIEIIARDKLGCTIERFRGQSTINEAYLTAPIHGETSFWHGFVNGEYWEGFNEEAKLINPIYADYLDKALKTECWDEKNIALLEKSAIENGMIIERYKGNSNLNRAMNTVTSSLKDVASKLKCPDELVGYSGIRNSRTAGYIPSIPKCCRISGLIEYIEKVRADVIKYLMSEFSSYEVQDWWFPTILLDDGCRVSTYLKSADVYACYYLSEIADDYHNNSDNPQYMLESILRNAEGSWQITLAILHKLEKDSSHMLDSDAIEAIHRAYEVLNRLIGSSNEIGTCSGLYTGRAIYIYYKNQGDFCNEEQYKSEIANTVAHEMFHAFHHHIAPDTFGKGMSDSHAMLDENENVYIPGNRDLQNNQNYEEYYDFDEQHYHICEDYPQLPSPNKTSIKEQWENTVVEEATAEYFALLFTMSQLHYNISAWNESTVISQAIYWENSYNTSPYSFALHFLDGIRRLTHYGNHQSNADSIPKWKKVIEISCYSMKKAFECLISNDVWSLSINSMDTEIQIEIAKIKFDGSEKEYSYLCNKSTMTTGYTQLESDNALKNVEVVSVIADNLSSSGHPLNYYTVVRTNGAELIALKRYGI